MLNYEQQRSASASHLLSPGTCCEGDSTARARESGSCDEIIKRRGRERADGGNKVGTNEVEQVVQANQRLHDLAVAEEERKIAVNHAAELAQDRNQLLCRLSKEQCAKVRIHV